MRALLTFTLFVSILFAAVPSRAAEYCVLPANADGSRPIDEDDILVFTAQDRNEQVLVIDDEVLDANELEGEIALWWSGPFPDRSNIFVEGQSLTPLRGVIIQRGEQRGANPTVVYVLNPEILFPGDRTISISPFIDNGDSSNGRSVQDGVIYYKYKFSLDDPPVGS